MPSNVLFSIDLKVVSDKCYLVHDIIKSYNCERRVVWGSGDEAAHAKLKELDADIPTYYPEASLTKTFIWHLLGCLFCFKLENDFLLAPIMTSE